MHIHILAQPPAEPAALLGPLQLLEPGFACGLEGIVGWLLAQRAGGRGGRGQQQRGCDQRQQAGGSWAGHGARQQ